MMSSPSLAPRSNQSITPSTGASNGNPKVTKIITSREWVLPPRPKPGRKPSVDTPATKRKAQNRAAQRAFRERRANRVSELETQILELEREKSIKEGILTNTIKSLQLQNDSLKKSMNEMKATLEMVQKQLPQSKEQQKIKRRVSTSGVSPTTIPESVVSTPQGQQPYTPVAISDAIKPTQQQHKRSSSAVSSTSSVGRSSLSSISQHDSDLNKAASMMINFKNSSRRNSASSISNANSPLTLSVTPSSTTFRKDRNSVSISLQQISPASSSDSPPLQQEQQQQPASSNFDTIHEGDHDNEEDKDCGICFKDDCICESIGLKSKTLPVSVEFDNFKPAAAVPLKRTRESTAEQEIDFTNTFKRSKLKKLPTFKSLGNSRISATSSSISNPQGQQNDMLFKSPMSFSMNDEPSDFSSQVPQEVNKKEEFTDIPPEDQCGFCSDDTPCVCREIAKQKELVQIKDSLLTNELNNRQPQQLLSQIRPSLSNSGCINNSSKLSDSINSNGIIKVEEQEKSKDTGCSGNPGTCLQCQKDPMSTLFCTTIAQQSATTRKARTAANTPTSSGSSSTNSLFSSSSVTLPNSPFAKPQNSALSTPPSSIPQLETLKRSNSVNSLPALSDLEINNPGKYFIPCADAYKTLSRHANFQSAGFNNIINNLNTKGMYVEVESVVNCLRELDRKFGSN